MGSVFLRGKSWVIEYRVKGKTKRESVGKKGAVTKTMAREILRKIEQLIKLGQYDILDAKIPTFNEFGKDYVEYLKDIKTNRSWDRDLHSIRCFGELYGNNKLSEISPGDIDVYKKIRLQKVKPGTVNRELQCIRPLFNQAKKRKKFFGENPVSEDGLIKVNDQKERILTKEEEERLISASSPSLRVIITCALNTAMRKGEIISLKWDTVDLDNNVITLEHTNTKSKRTRTIPINSIMRKLLLELKLRSGGSEYVFLNSEGMPYQRHDSLNRAFYGACKRAYISGLRFHDLRHTSATRMVEHGSNIVAVSKILGHADLKTTMRYAHPDDSLKDAVESLTTSNSEPVTDKSTDNM